MELLETLLNPTVLGYVAIVFVALLFYLANKSSWVSKNKGLIVKVFNEIEKVIPDETKNKWLAKADVFLKRFGEEYTRRTGKELTEAQKQAVQDEAAKLAYAQKAGL